MMPITRPVTAALAAAILVAASTTACGGGPPVVPGPQRPATVLDEAAVRAVAQLIRYEDQREYDATAFDRLAAGDEEVRRRVALAAGRIGDTLAVPLLVRLLDDDPSPAVRADAAFALGELGDTSRVVIESLREAVAPGWTPVRPAETAVSVEVVQALGKLGTFDARAMVVHALRAAHPGDSPERRRVAAEALLSIWRFEDGPGRVNAVVRYVDSPDGELRWRAAYALMRLGEPEGAPYLLTLLSDDDHRARANAARGLAAAVVDSAGVRDTALVALTAALRDEHPHVRVNAVRSLAGYGGDAPVDAMARLLRNADPQVAIAAAGALAERAGDATAALVAAVSDARRPYPLRAAAARAVAAAAPDTVAAELGRWSEGGLEARYAAARSVAALTWPHAEPLIRRLADDADRRIAVAALVSAGQLAADSAADDAQRAALRALLERFARGSEPRLAVVAVGALEGVADSVELAVLRDRVDEPVATAIPPTAERDAAFYEEIAREYVAGPLAGEPLPRAVVETADGEIILELLAPEAPLTVHNFITLARAGFWDDGVWHRVIPNFVLQDGAPAGDPNGGPGWSIRDEINRVRYARGVLGMALAGPDTGGSQWFITLSPQHHLDGGYTVFGRVVDGMDTADSVLQGDPIAAIRVPR